MKSIKEKAEEAERNTQPLFESFRESDGKPVSVYEQDDMISMFEAGANYVLNEIEKCVKSSSNSRLKIDTIKQIIEQLKSNQ
jgi:archaellum component FlaC